MLVVVQSQLTLMTVNLERRAASASLGVVFSFNQAIMIYPAQLEAERTSLLCSLNCM